MCCFKPFSVSRRFAARILNADGVVRRVYTVMGKTNLTDAAWTCPTNAAHRFFNVKVEVRSPRTPCQMKSDRH